MFLCYLYIFFYIPLEQSIKNHRLIMNVLLICSYFGPETSVGVNRVNSFVRHWLNKGCSIDVITMPYHEDLPIFLQYQNRLTVHKVPPMFFSKKQKNAQSYSQSGVNSKSKLKKVFYWLKKNIFANYLDPRLLWWPKAALFANKICKQKEMDFVISSVPSYTSHSIGSVIKRMNPAIYWVADYRDLWSGNPIFPGTAFVRWIERKHERFILKRADLLVTINDDLASDLEKLHGPKKMLVVPNGFESSDLMNYGSAAKEQKNYLSIVYTGTVLSGLQHPEPLFVALRNLIERNLVPNHKIKILFYGDASAIPETESFKYLLDNKMIELKGRVSRDISLMAQHHADLLLFLGARHIQKSADVKGIVSGKIFEYLVSGVEIMAVGVNNQMIVGDMIQLAVAGDIYDENIAKIEERLLNLVKLGPKKITPNQEYLSQFNREKQASRLLAEIGKALKKAGVNRV
jgi:hypothetical protein